MFLGYIISVENITMNLEKVSAVISWLTPQSALDIQTFLSLANFYRQFIKDFSKTIASITKLLQKNVQFHWNTTVDKAFKTFKKAFTTVLILKHFNYSHLAVVKANISDFTQGDVLSQHSDNEVLHSVTFHS